MYEGIGLLFRRRVNGEETFLYEKEKQKGNANRASLAVARKLVAYLLAVDRRERGFEALENHRPAAA